MPNRPIVQVVFHNLVVEDDLFSSCYFNVAKDESKCCGLCFSNVATATAGINFLQGDCLLEKEI
jgi:hypothetical protein